MLAQALITLLTLAGVLLPGVGLALAFRAAVRQRDALAEEVEYKRAAWARYRAQAGPEVPWRTPEAIAAARAELDVAFEARGFRLLDFDVLNVIVEETDQRRLAETLQDLQGQLGWFIAGAVCGLAGAIWDVWLP